MPLSPSVFMDALALYVIVMVWRNMNSAAGGEQLAADGKVKRGETENLFRVMLGVSALMLVTDAACWQLDGWVFPNGRLILLLLNSLLYLLQAFYCRLWVKYEILCLFGRISMNRLIWTVVSNIPLAAMTALIVSNLWTRRVFIIDEGFFYLHGQGYSLALGIISLYVLWAASMAIAGLRRAATSQQRRNCLGMMQFMSLQIIGAVCEVFSLNISLTAPLIALGLLMVYLNVQQHAATQQQLVIARQQQELTEKQIAVMLSQIQPHFLYNSLNSIAQLCVKDPKKAETVTVAFSEYLRQNMQSLERKDPIPFGAELEHIKTYLYIEQIRFGRELRVEYDIRATDFTIPALALQPLVENAVKHGVGMKEEGGTVWISAREEPEYYEIRVRDDGVGFDPAGPMKDDRPHVGISNVRRRLEMMCQGRLEIKSVPQEGTEAIIQIPRRTDHEDTGP